jgi:hypothetical protein
VINSRRVGWAGHVAHKGEVRNAYRILVGNAMETDHLQKLGVDEKIILGKWGGCGLDSSGSGYGPVVGSCEHGNEPLGSIKGGEFLH